MVPQQEFKPWFVRRNKVLTRVAVAEVPFRVPAKPPPLCASGYIPKHKISPQILPETPNNKNMSYKAKLNI